jgi:hypothetical protein
MQTASLKCQALQKVESLLSGLSAVYNRAYYEIEGRKPRFGPSILFLNWRKRHYDYEEHA